MVDFGQQIAKIQAEMLQLEKLWQLKKFSPNPQQKDAIRHTDGPLFITAGPGSGKTRVLLWRVLNLVVFHDTRPEHIFLSTFTEKAAHQLKEGLRELLSIVTSINGQPYDLSQMYIGTVHSLCQRILTDQRRFGFHQQHASTPGLMDELGQYFHIAQYGNWERICQPIQNDEVQDVNAAVNQLFGSPKTAKHAAITGCIAFFNRLSEECIDPQQALAKLAEADQVLAAYLDEQGIAQPNLEQLLRMYACYLESLRMGERLRKTDFSLLQQEAFRLIADRPQSAQAFKYVIIDEYQDTNTIQERIFFELTRETHNLCVVGDDDQALYRFRGATVENFVDFPQRCLKNFRKKPQHIPLSVNYRSREDIVSFYGRFMGMVDWRRQDGNSGFYRVADKVIKADRQDAALSAVASTAQKPELVCAEIAQLVRQLLDQGKVEDPNQIAFLYPSLKTVHVDRMRSALENVGLQVYAPRAGRFLEVDEAYDIFGMIALVLGLPELEGGWGGDYGDFVEWINQVELNAKQLCRQDAQLQAFVDAKKEEIARACRDYLALKRVVEHEGWVLAEPFSSARMKRKLHDASGFSAVGRQLLGSVTLERYLHKREQEGRPLNLSYIIKRVTSLDWSVLDLFYRLFAFSHFKTMFDLAENGTDEGPICNLRLISQYLARFVEDFMPMLTADLLVENIFHRVFYFSYLFALFRRGESEYEDAEDPFPKGRIPFLTIHQSKGLEFPVVVLGNPHRKPHPPNFEERAVRPFSHSSASEPLERQTEFDTARMFYVALSRAQNLLVIPHFKGQGQSISEPFRSILGDGFARIPDLQVESIPPYSQTKEELPRMYSYTADYLLYNQCPRQYMVFRKYGFVPSRAQTMFFGSLVHRTLEDLHHELIRRRGEVVS